MYSSNPLISVVSYLSPAAKQAMWAASEKNPIKRGTWNGCAFNAAGVEVDQAISSSAMAARAFQMPELKVRSFIQTWDHLEGEDWYCTSLLREALDQVGLFTPARTEVKSHTSRVTRETREKVYVSKANLFKEQLESGELTLDMIPGCDMALQLLSACSS